jgi:hypothetical protein
MLHERRRTPNSVCSIWRQAAQASGEGLSRAGRDVRCTARRSTAVVAREPDDYSVDRFGHTGASVRHDGRAFAAHPRKRGDKARRLPPLAPPGHAGAVRRCPFAGEDR